MDNAPADQPPKTRTIKANPPSLAARWNTKLFRALKAKLKTDPEADISALLPSNYSQTLQTYKRSSVQRPDRPSFPDDDIRSRLSIAGPWTTLFELSPEVNRLLGAYNSLSHAVMDLLAQSEIIYKSAWAASVTVFRVSQGIAVKITHDKSAVTEIESLLYLQKNLPTFPAPKPQGLIQTESYCLLFTTFIPGLDLEKAWPQLDETQKQSISTQLDKALIELRSLPHPSKAPLGGVSGEGCKDARRSLRINNEPIMNAAQFEDFIFAGSRAASPLYIQFLRSLKPVSSPACVLTHGDIRPANIIVDQSGDSTWRLVAIIDWENSGFYPAYWECVKMTNNLLPSSNDDWYSYLPESVSPRKYPTEWLVDRILDRSLVNS